jgi:hypothetical protein
MNQPSVAQPVSAIEDPENAPNLLLGVIAGGLAMIIGALVWAAVSYFTNYQIGWLSIGVGFLVGIAIRTFGKGKSIAYGILGGLLSLIAVLLGNLLFYSGIIAAQEGMSFVGVLFGMIFSPIGTIEIFAAAFEFIDLLFYALAVYAGFRYSFS